MTSKVSELCWALAVALGATAGVLGDPWCAVCAGALVWLGFRMRRYGV